MVTFKCAGCNWPAAFECVGIGVFIAPATWLYPKAISKTDMISFTCFACGVAALSAFLVQGRIVWWDKIELGQLLLVALIGRGITLMMESNRKEPMIKLDWLRSKELLWLGLTAAFLRMVMSEQNVGSAGLLTALAWAPRKWCRITGS